MPNPAAIRRRAIVALASFLATLCITLLAPVVHPVVFELLCSAEGNRLIASSDASDDGAVRDADPRTNHADHAAHCPLCMPAASPPPAIAWDFTPARPLAHVQQGIPAARLASLVGAPLPARGPPLAS